MNALTISRQQTGPDICSKDFSEFFPFSQSNEIKPSMQKMANNNNNNDCNQRVENSDNNDKRNIKNSKGKKTIDCPVFLQKTYRMIDTCDPAIAEWAEDGESFVIKDAEILAKKVIPQFFKHNKFSSFVRQLNFYGFRKIRKSPIMINPTVEEIESQYWRFRHRHFVRGRPDLLLEIRKPNQNILTDHQEIETLKTEVKMLKSEMIAMKNNITSTTSEIAGLKSLVHKLVDELSENNKCVASSETNSHFKRRRLNPNEYPPQHVSPEIPTFPNQISSITNDVAGDDKNTVDFDRALTELGPTWQDKLSTGLDSSATTHSSLGQNLCTGIMSTFVPPSEATSNVANTKDNILDPDFLRRLNDSISSASDVRNVFSVEKFHSNNNTNPGCFEKQMNELSAFVATASRQTQRINSRIPPSA